MVMDKKVWGMIFGVFAVAGLLLMM